MSDITKQKKKQFPFQITTTSMSTPSLSDKNIQKSIQDLPTETILVPKTKENTLKNTKDTLKPSLTTKCSDIFFKKNEKPDIHFKDANVESKSKIVVTNVEETGKNKDKLQAIDLKFLEKYETLGIIKDNSIDFTYQKKSFKP